MRKKEGERKGGREGGRERGKEGEREGGRGRRGMQLVISEPTVTVVPKIP